MTRRRRAARQAKREQAAIAEARHDAAATGVHHPWTETRLRVDAIDDAQDETIPDSPDDPLADLDPDRVLAWMDGAEDAELDAMAGHAPEAVAVDIDDGEYVRGPSPFGKALETK